jgi:hypothetical protein
MRTDCTGLRSSRCRSTSRSFGHAGARHALVCVRARVCLCVCACVRLWWCDEPTLWTCRPCPAQPSPGLGPGPGLCQPLPTLGMRHSAVTTALPQCAHNAIRSDPIALLHAVLSGGTDVRDTVPQRRWPLTSVPRGQRQCTCSSTANSQQCITVTCSTADLTDRRVGLALSLWHPRTLTARSELCTIGPYDRSEGYVCLGSPR